MVTIRDYGAQIKAVGKEDGLGEGQFEAIVSVFGNVDTYGDRVMPGAFDADIAEWKNGKVLPIVWSHKWEDPFSHLGSALDVKATDKGLLVKAQIEDLAENATAAQVHRLLKSRRITQFSFAYDILDAGMVTEEVKGAEKDAAQTRDVFELRGLKTHEVGPCLLGVNQETELLGAKAANLALGVASGRQLNGRGLERIQKTIDALREVIVLSSAATGPVVEEETGTGYPADVPDEQSPPVDPPADDDPPEGKSVEASHGIARRAAMVDLMFLD